MSQNGNPFDFSSPADVSPIRQVAQNAIGRQARRGSLVLFFVGGLQLIFMFLFTGVLVGEMIRLNEAARFLQDPAEASLPLVVYFYYALGLILGGLFVGLAFWARSDPLLASLIGLGVYLGANAFDFLLLFGFGITILPAGSWFWLLRIFIVLLLIDAIRAGFAYRRIVNKLIVELGERVVDPGENS
jgi:hypothetical protein